MSLIRTLELLYRHKLTLLFICVVNIALLLVYLTYSFKVNIPSSIDREHINTTKGYEQTNTWNVTYGNSFDMRIKDTYKTGKDGCGDLSFPKSLPTENNWYPVDENRTAFVFSAYLVQNPRQLVVLGAKERNRLLYRCQYWYYDNVTDVPILMEEVTANRIFLPEGHGKRYLATIFTCALKQTRTPKYVSVVLEKCQTPHHILDVSLTNRPLVKERRFTVCLPSLNKQYGDVHRFIEWFELNRILGAEKFIIYNYSSAMNVTRLLEFYSKRGLVEVVQWRLPMNVDEGNVTENPSEIHYFGQVAALNDCLYRNKMISEFIVNIDIDEYIIPYSYKESTWSDILTQLDSLNLKDVHTFKQSHNLFNKKKVKNRTTPALYLFRNTFFHKEWTHRDILAFNKTTIEKYRLITLQKFERERYIFPPTVRSKYIARTSDISSVMVHTVRDLPYGKVLYVPPSIGLLYHYRNCEDLSPINDERVLDITVMRKYGTVLVERIQNIWSALQDDDTDLHP